MNVLLINKKDITPLQEKILERFMDFQQAMIDKDLQKLNETISDEFILTHMSGKKQTKLEFIDEIKDGTLNYYKTTINNPDIVEYDEKAIFDAEITLDAKVYGIKGTWTLHSMQEMKKINNEWYISEWNTSRM